jgi:hypothetical protein
VREPIVKPIVMLLAGAACGVAAFGFVSCSGGDDKPKGSTSASQGRADTSAGNSGHERGGGARAGGAKSRTPGSAGYGGAQSQHGSGGARAPRLDGAPRKRSLERYLASKYRQAPWYPLLKRLRITGGHVGVYLNFSPDDDDETPPVMACTAVLSYGRPVTRVTVYGLPTSQGKTASMKQC